MKILIVSQMNLDSSTGVTTYYVGLKNEYLKRGHVVDIITPDETPVLIMGILKFFRRVSNFFGWEFLKLATSEFIYFVSIFFAVKKSGKKRQWDIIHGQDPSSSLAAKKALGNTIPAVTTCHFNDNPVAERKLKYRLTDRQISRVTRWFKFLFAGNTNFIFISEYSYNQTKWLLGEKVNMEIIPNGVPFCSRKNIAPDKDLFIISNVGTIEDRKNQILLIDAGVELARKGINFKIWLLGNGPKKDEWEEKVKNANLEAQIIFWGYQKKAIEIIADSDLYVHVAKNENCSISILEAFSIGLPVIAIANGGIPEQFAPDGGGLVLAGTNAVALAGKIERNLNYSALKKLQQEQSDYSFSKFTIEKMATRNLDFYTFILSPNNQKKPLKNNEGAMVH